MLEKLNLLSVNQLVAQIKLIEVWKAENVESYALSFEPYKKPRLDQGSGLCLRQRTNQIFDDTCRLQVSKQSFSIDAARLWNLTPPEITTAATLMAAKAAILAHVKSFPI